jgi:hypothetical protein
VVDAKTNTDSPLGWRAVGGVLNGIYAARFNADPGPIVRHFADVNT